MHMLAEDIEAGKGHLRIRQSDTSKFTLGVNMAATPGKVVFRNDLIELIQYAPTTEMVDRRPLLIVPPWINKYYILDLGPEKSFVRWAVAQGLTVFMISWINPDQRLAHKNFEDYLREGILAALDAIEQATGERDVATVGYCVGGTLLAAALAYMAAKGDDRITSATFLGAQVDFTSPGDLKIFIDEARISALEEKIATTGYLDAAPMACAFNMLRPNDLIWSYVVNNYLKGREPLPFDLLTWNSDSTRMPAATFSFYLRNCYLDNKLAKGEMVIGGERLDLAKVRVPVYRARHARRSHRAGEVGLHGRKNLRRRRALRCSPAPAISPASSIRRRNPNINIGPDRVPKAPTKTGCNRPKNTPAAGGRTGSPGSKPSHPPKCRRASPAPASSNRCATRLEPM